MTEYTSNTLHVCSDSQQNIFRKLLDFCLLAIVKKKRIFFLNYLCYLGFVGYSNTTEHLKKKKNQNPTNLGY